VGETRNTYKTLVGNLEEEKQKILNNQRVRMRTRLSKLVYSPVTILNTVIFKRVVFH
jgi:hypothetical protein